jgi:glycosyltransferase involved in cell wall biosynthesis
MKLLFIKQSLSWPRSSGHDVHGYNMMKACAALGHEVSLATAHVPSADAVAGLPLNRLYSLAESDDGARPVAASWLQRRFRRFYGVPDHHVAAGAAIARESKADAVIVVGLDVLPYFPPLRGVRRVWYAADEWVLHHVSQLKFGDSHFKENLQNALVKGLYERAHRRVIDRVWVVSEPEQRAMRWFAGMSNVDVVPNGVDGDYFAPGSEAPEQNTAVFWGRLDFGPNIQALQWFVTRVWPGVRRAVSDARFTIVGFQPVPAVVELAQTPGVSLLRDVPDLRRTVRTRQVAVLPFRSGGGVKNKLLEAAALGMPIVGTPLATRGLHPGHTNALIAEEAPDAFAQALVSLWNEPARRAQMGAAARCWVLENHSWDSTARTAMAALRP